MELVLLSVTFRGTILVQLFVFIVIFDVVAGMIVIGSGMLASSVLISSAVLFVWVFFPWLAGVFIVAAFVLCGDGVLFCCQKLRVTHFVAAFVVAVIFSFYFIPSST